MTFDSDILVWYLRGNDRARQFVIGYPFELRRVSAMVYFELLQGCASQREIRTVQRFIAQNISRILHLSDQVSHRASSLLERYAASHGLEAADALIAATALVSRDGLATGNVAHYRPVPGLNLVRFSA
jgi:hypothetical protein